LLCGLVIMPMIGTRIFSVKPGFTLIEAMVSVSILGLLALMVTVNLGESRRTEELNSAARVIAADIRSVQSRALSVKNIKFCQDLADKWISCELSLTACKGGSVCTSSPPDGVGIHFTELSNTYQMYGTLNGTGSDFIMEKPEQAFQVRNLETTGAANVIVSRISSKIIATNSADVFFLRQNGSMRLNACLTCGAEPGTLLIAVQHTQSNKIKTIVLNGLTGRISIE